ncbi:MAG TPA: hypothetical protein VNT99_08210 [Methylomirabilota bacterium]|nr:hypothetical protein [Methylomirabilota bacterium]
MKKLILTLTIFSLALLQQVCATTFLPHLDPIRAEILNQQVIVSNTVPLNKPLATALRKARTTLDRTTPTNLVNDTKTLATVTATLNKTSVSNVFDPLIRTALANYVAVIENALNTASNALLVTFPSGPHTTANNLIDDLFDSVEGALANVNSTLATKALAAATKKLGTINSLLAKAISAPAPPVQLRATITAGGEGTFKFQPTPSRAAAAALIGNLVQITGVQIQRIGATSVRSRTVSIGIPNIPNGTTVYSIGGGGANASVIYTISEGGLGSPPTGDAYTATSGTLTVTWNSATRAAVGTFTFSGPGANNPGNTASSSDGVFSVVAQ